MAMAIPLDTINRQSLSSNGRALGRRQLVHGADGADMAKESQNQLRNLNQSLLYSKGRPPTHLRKVDANHQNLFYKMNRQSLSCLTHPLGLLRLVQDVDDADKAKVSPNLNQ
jgi:hypothetical protein